MTGVQHHAALQEKNALDHFRLFVWVVILAIAVLYVAFIFAEGIPGIFDRAIVGEQLYYSLCVTILIGIFAALVVWRHQGAGGLLLLCTAFAQGVVLFQELGMVQWLALGIVISPYLNAGLIFVVLHFFDSSHPRPTA